MRQRRGREGKEEGREAGGRPLKEETGRGRPRHIEIVYAAGSKLQLLTGAAGKSEVDCAAAAFLLPQSSPPPLRHS